MGTMSETVSESTLRRRRKLAAELEEAACELSDAIEATGLTAGGDHRIRDLHGVCVTMLDDPGNTEARRLCLTLVGSWAHTYVKGVRGILVYAATCRLANYAQTIYRETIEWTPTHARMVMDDLREGLALVNAAESLTAEAA